MRRALLPLGLLLLATTTAAHADVTVRFTTTPSGGQYQPKYVLAAWLEKQDGTFVKTLGRWANVRKSSLTAWTAKAGANDVDAISGATQDAHIARTVKWNLRDRAGAVLPDGMYVVRLESSDANPGGARNTASFTVTKGATDGNQGSNLSQGGFTAVTIDYNNATQSCGDGYVDAGEKCDPGREGSCPTECPASTLMCFEGVVVGDPAACGAQCVQMMITACADDDGCCPAGCTGADDSDCPGGGGGGGNEPEEISSCATSSGAGWMLALLGVFFVLRRRR